MNILMVTNTYRPFTGGVPRSVDTFSRQYRKLGHAVKIVAPDFEGQEEDPDVIRVPAIRHFNGTEFSVQLPVPFFLSQAVEDFRPDVIHSHHPFLLGSTALRLAAMRGTPLLYTFHTFYEQYLHYVPGGETAAMKRFVSALVAGYANLCDHIIAPSHSVSEELRRRKVTKPIDVIPTGVDVEAIAKGNGMGFRKRHGIPPDALALGFVSRLAKEKNLDFLCEAVLLFLRKHEKAWFLLAGTGPLETELQQRFHLSGAESRIAMLGNLGPSELPDFYRALDVFVFTSVTETQGLVVAEALAAGCPVVALRGPGITDMVRDTYNGRLLEREDAKEFAAALEWIAAMEGPRREALKTNALKTAKNFSDEICARRTISLYQAARREAKTVPEHQSAWDEFTGFIVAEWNLMLNIGTAAGEALVNP
jgi:1,2-diacylglycerol 3-alpha-glucosyltransferase